MPDYRTGMLRLILLAVALWISPAHASEHPCISEPAPRCLIQNLLALASQQPDAPWLTPALATHLQFEAQQWQLSSSLGTQQQNLIALLEQEERFLSHLRMQRWDEADALLPDLAPSLHDYWGSPPVTLMLEALALSLQDARADTLKRHFYASLLSLDNQDRARRMLAVARHEILGGQPDKGRATLANTDIDAFSPSEFFQARRNMEMLATRSEQIFLQPDQGLQQCNDPATVNTALLMLLSDDLLVSLHALPDTSSRIDMLLLLARTYHNGAQCKLLTLWLGSQAVSLSNHLPIDSTDTLLQRILLARSIRRYLQ